MAELTNLKLSQGIDADATQYDRWHIRLPM
jgi:hypothetical protein